MKKKTCKGSFTLESAVIVPITMAVIVALLLFTLSVHDGVILNTVSTVIIMENASRFSKEPQNIQGKIMEMLSKRLVITRNIAVDVTGGEDDCTAECSGSFQIASGFIRGLTGTDITDLHSQINISNLNGRRTLLKYKTVCDGVSGLLQEGDAEG
ncbi:MAG: hypothetical protein IKZ95_02620 [Lachnospiraceae bacterium]|nr:hypothetical protein [Lachnospiraceae bacterium]